MRHRTALLILMVLAPTMGPLPVDPLDGPDPTTAPAVTGIHRPASLDPVVAVQDGSTAQRRRLDLAVHRFLDSGLALPDLEVVFAPRTSSCKGHPGLFDRRHEPWRISICSDLDAVYEHELAHAWAAANLTDDDRMGFMVLRGYEVWSDSDVPWNERGTEGAAFVIQQGLSGLPLPPVLSDDLRGRLHAFEFLTGAPDPRLAVWEQEHGTEVDGASTDM